MGFEDWFRLSVHAVITNPDGQVLLLKAAYGDLAWGLPGGALEPGETIHEALRRECAEELGCDVVVGDLTGVYSHTAVQSQAFIFRCELAGNSRIVLSSEHSEFSYVDPDGLAPVQRRRVLECLNFSGHVFSARF
jgi:8-oxo-dGTP diphosphatase